MYVEEVSNQEVFIFEAESYTGRHASKRYVCLTHAADIWDKNSVTITNKQKKKKRNLKRASQKWRTNGLKKHITK